MTAELNEQLKFAGCTSPLPLKCPICKRGNGGIGLDYCYLRHLIKTETKTAVAEERERVAKMSYDRANELSHPILGEPGDQYWARVGRMAEARALAVAIRKGVKA